VEIEGERRRLPASAFRRWWLNEWTQSQDALLSVEDVTACAVLRGPLSPRPGITYLVRRPHGRRRRSATPWTNVHARPGNALCGLQPGCGGSSCGVLTCGDVVHTCWMIQCGRRERRRYSPGSPGLYDADPR
jgi:hypothetical protein